MVSRASAVDGVESHLASDAFSACVRACESAIPDVAEEAIFALERTCASARSGVLAAAHRSSGAASTPDEPPVPMASRASASKCGVGRLESAALSACSRVSGFDGATVVTSLAAAVSSDLSSRADTSASSMSLNPVHVAASVGAAARCCHAANNATAFSVRL